MLNEITYGQRSCRAREIVPLEQGYHLWFSTPFELGLKLRCFAIPLLPLSAGWTATELALGFERNHIAGHWVGSRPQIEISSAAQVFECKLLVKVVFAVSVFRAKTSLVVKCREVPEAAR